MLINCTLPAINYSTCCGGEANVLMHHNVERMCCAALHVLSTYKTVYWLHSIYALLCVVL